MTRSQSARSTPPGWSMKMRSDSLPGSLHGDQVELRIEVGELLLNVLLEVGHAWCRA